MADEILSLSQHLSEIRRRVIISLISIFIGSVISYTQLDWMLGLLTRPIGKLVFIAPHEAFLTFLKLALLGGIILSSPIIIYHICKFVWIALHREEKGFFVMYGFLMLLFFLAGACFSSFLMLPIVTRFLLSFQRGNLVPMISVDKYVSYFLLLFLCFTIIFELPLVMAMLTRLNLIDPFKLSRKRRYVIVTVFIVGAILTPPDIFTQFLMAVPLLVLFEISLVFSKLIKKKIAG